MANTSTIVITNAPDYRDDGNSGALSNDAEGRLKRILEEFGTFVSIAYS